MKYRITFHGGHTYELYVNPARLAQLNRYFSREYPDHVEITVPEWAIELARARQDTELYAGRRASGLPYPPPRSGGHLLRLISCEPL